MGKKDIYFEFEKGLDNYLISDFISRGKIYSLNNKAEIVSVSKDSIKNKIGNTFYVEMTLANMDSSLVEIEVYTLNPIEQLPSLPGDFNPPKRDRTTPHNICTKESKYLYAYNRIDNSWITLWAQSDWAR